MLFKCCQPLVNRCFTIIINSPITTGNIINIPIDDTIRINTPVTFRPLPRK